MADTFARVRRERPKLGASTRITPRERIASGPLAARAAMDPSDGGPGPSGLNVRALERLEERALEGLHEGREV
ncbi:MAG: hypothetical protein KC586_29655, partial [Myxococcales bacterium]|nr:hypothetical protein [Myxococcales bacterium]